MDFSNFVQDGSRRSIVCFLENLKIRVNRDRENPGKSQNFTFCIIWNFLSYLRVFAFTSWIKKLEFRVFGVRKSMIFTIRTGLCYSQIHCRQKMESIFLYCNFALTAIMKKWKFTESVQIWSGFMLIRMVKKHTISQRLRKTHLTQQL